MSEQPRLDPQDDAELDALLERRSAVSQAWREQDTASTPPQLDAAVLDFARRAHKPIPHRSRWQLPLAAAATLVLVSGLLYRSAPDTPETAMKSAIQDAAPPEAAPAPAAETAQPAQPTLTATAPVMAPATEPATEPATVPPAEPAGTSTVLDAARERETLQAEAKDAREAGAETEARLRHAREARLASAAAEPQAKPRAKPELAAAPSAAAAAMPPPPPSAAFAEAARPAPTPAAATLAAPAAPSPQPVWIFQDAELADPALSPDVQSRLAEAAQRLRTTTGPVRISGRDTALRTRLRTAVLAQGIAAQRIIEDSDSPNGETRLTSSNAAVD